MSQVPKKQASGPHGKVRTGLQAVRRHASVLLIALGVLGMSYGAHQLWAHHRAVRSTTTVTAHTQSPIVATQPTETPVHDPGYTVPADQPRSIELPSIGARGYIQSVGVDTHNAIAAPGNVNVAGWYIKSARPGDRGVSIIDGHVQGRYSPGIFKNLSKITAEDHIRIEFGDHSWRTFVVMHIDTLPVDDVSNEQYRQLPDVERQLTLITCAGRFNRATNSYDQRTLIRARLIE